MHVHRAVGLQLRVAHDDTQDLTGVGTDLLEELVFDIDRPAETRYRDHGADKSRSGFSLHDHKELFHFYDFSMTVSQFSMTVSLFKFCEKIWKMHFLNRS